MALKSKFIGFYITGKLILDLGVKKDINGNKILKTKRYDFRKDGSNYIVVPVLPPLLITLLISN